MALPPSAERTRKENAAGLKAAGKLRVDLRREATRFNVRSGDLRKSGASKRMRNGELRAIALRIPKYGYVQHHGWIGTKMNGVFQRLPKTEWISDAVLNNSALDVLADEISEARADQVIATIRFGKR